MENELLLVNGCYETAFVITSSLWSGLLPCILRINILTATVQLMPYLENCQSNRVVILLTSRKPFYNIGNTSTSGGHV